MSDDVIVETEMSDDWHSASTRIGASSKFDHAIFRDMIATIVIPKAFTSIKADGRIVAKAYGAIHDGLLVLELVATDPGLSSTWLFTQSRIGVDDMGEDARCRGRVPAGCCG